MRVTEGLAGWFVEKGPGMGASNNFWPTREAAESEMAAIRDAELCESWDYLKRIVGGRP